MEESKDSPEEKFKFAKVIKLTNKKECDGLFFRCKINNFYNRNRRSIELKVAYTLLKRKSCKGCNTCNYFLECMSEDVELLHSELNPIDGAVYRLDYTPPIPDHFAGDYHDEEFNLERVKESEI